MKKIFLLLALVIASYAVSAQTTVSLTPDTTGTIIGTAAGNYHNFTSPVITNAYQGFAIEVYVTTSGTHATDSTHVEIYASEDGTNYFMLTDLGTPYLISTAKYRSAFTVGYKLSSEGTGAVGWVWKGSASTLPYRYIRVKVTQYKVSSILTVNRCKLHLFK